jgi:hypothetical protein
MLLREAIKRNYDEFEKTVIDMDCPEVIYGLAPTISAVKDIHHYLSVHDWADEDEAAYLLTKENPLYYLAEVWREELDGFDVCFGDILREVCGFADDNPVRADFTIQDELRIKYGVEMPLETAALLELLELGKMYLRRSVLDDDFEVFEYKCDDDDFDLYDYDDTEDDY